MDKIEIALQIIYRLIDIEGGIETIDIKSVFRFVNEFELESIRRRLYFPTQCPHCEEPLITRDLSTSGKPYFQLKCSCSDLRGSDKNELIKKWIVNWNDN